MNLMNLLKVMAASCEGVDTAIIGCGDSESGIGHVLALVINIASVGVGILAVIGIVYSGIQYLTAADNEEKVRKAKRRIFEIVIGLIAYVLAYVLLQWLMPGGSLNPADIEHYDVPEATVPAATGTGAGSGTGSSTGGSGSSSGSGAGGTRAADGGSGGSGNSGGSNTPVAHFDKTDGWTELSYKHSDGTALSYGISIPEGATDGMPLLIFLHGGGEYTYRQFLATAWSGKIRSNQENNAQKYIAIAPASPTGTWTNDLFMNAVGGLIDQTINGYVMDAKRVYIMGFSNGGNGTCYMVAHRPSFFAAAMPVSGGSTCVSSIESLRNAGTPLKVEAGDGEGNKTLMQKLVDELGVEYRWYSLGGGTSEQIHGRVSGAFDFDTEVEWLLARHR